MSDTTLDDVSKAVAAGNTSTNTRIDATNAKLDATNARLDALEAQGKLAPPLFQFYRDGNGKLADGTPNPNFGKIIAASGDHTYNLTDPAVYDLMVATGIGEAGFRNYDQNVQNWLTTIVDQGEFTPADIAAIKAHVAALKAQ